MSEPKLAIAYKAKYNKSCDGAGPDTVVGIYRSESRAKSAVNGKEPYGGDGLVERVLVAVLSDGGCIEIASAQWDTWNLMP
jgi:hypothetical protein